MKSLLIFLFLIIIVFGLFFVSLEIGSVRNVGVQEIINELFSGKITGVARYRLIRALATIILGAGLGLSGLTMQYALRNPLADPYLLGVSAGASLGVVVSLVFHSYGSLAAIYSVALIGGILAFFSVILISAGSGGSPSSLIVSGVSVSYALTGITLFIFIKRINQINLTFIWLFGTVAYVLYRYLIYSTLILIISLIILILEGNKIYTLILGDEVSESMGVNVKKTRYLSLIIAGVIASAMVALAGPVGFIGLASPWISRLIYGSNYRIVAGASMIIGAILAQISDIAVRLIGGGQELPLTAFTALFGGPLLFYLTRKTGW